MVSITSDDGRDPPAHEPLEPDHVYELYCRYKADELGAFLARPVVAASAMLQENYRRLCEPESREDFGRRLAGMTPNDRSAFESRLVAGYKISVERDARAAQSAADEAARSPASPSQGADVTTRATLAALDRLVPPRSGSGTED